LNERLTFRGFWFNIVLFFIRVKGEKL